MLNKGKYSGSFTKNGLGKSQTENFGRFCSETALNFSIKKTLFKIEPERLALRGVFCIKKEGS